MHGAPTTAEKRPVEHAVHTAAVALAENTWPTLHAEHARTLDDPAALVCWLGHHVQFRDPVVA